MRIVVVSDLHANPAALEAFQADAGRYDRLLCLGDLVTYGPSPRPCLEFVQKVAFATVRGNHDHALGYGEEPRCGPQDTEAAKATLEYHRGMLGDEDTDFLRKLPLTLSLRLGGQRVFLVHGGPRDPLFDRSLRPEAPEGHLEEATAHLDADLVLVGHTHLPMIRRAGRATIVNPGSLGHPRDGDPRASYAVVQDGRPEIRRVAYDVERTIRELGRAPLPPRATARLSGLLRRGE